MVRVSEAVLVALISAASGIVIALINGHKSHDSENDVDKLEHEVKELKKELRRERKDSNEN